MNKFQLIFHNIFRFLWNAIFVISYPVMATFGLLFVGLTYVFSALSRFLANLRPEKETTVPKKTDWEELPNTQGLLEAKVHKQIMFGPTCFQIRRKDGVPSVLEEYYFGGKIKFIEEGLLLEKWNTTDPKSLPDFDVCLYDPDSDRLTSLAHMKCFDWHLSERNDNQLLFKWFDGTQGGEVNVAL
ncbi:hypothetical protein [Cecembia calidifontis]|nr:hypothetical protein [Cecembia calidifontis]